MPPTDNNTFATATSIPNPVISPQSQSGSLSTGDPKDIYKFTLSSSSKLNVSLNGLTGNARLQLFQGNTPDAVSPVTTATISNNPKAISESLIASASNLTAGTYYIQVDLDSADVNATLADYTLNVSASADGRFSDLLWRDQDGISAKWLLDGKSLADTGFLEPRLGKQWRPTLGDFSGDGEDDIFWHNTVTGDVEVWIMKGKALVEAGIPSFTVGTQKTNASISGDWTTVATDVNNDGFEDVFLRNAKTGENAIWFFKGTALVSRLNLITVPTSWTPRLGEFNGDGQADIFWQNTDGTTAIWQLTPTGTGIGSAVFLPYQVPTSWVPKLADLDNNGSDDIFWRNSVSGENAVWITADDGLSFKDLAFLPQVPISWETHVGDLNNDGKADLFWRERTSGVTAAWLLNGKDVGPMAFLPYQVDTKWTVEALTDFSSDGKADLLWRHDDGTIAVWLFDGLESPSSGHSVLPHKLLKLPDNSLGYRLDGVFSRDLKAVPQSISGGTQQTAFNIGRLNAAAVYRDTVSSKSGDSDFFKFNVFDQTKFTMSANAAVKLELFRQETNGTLTAVPYNPTTASPSIDLTASASSTGATYFIKVSTTNGLTNYSLSVEGIPQVVQLSGTTFGITLPDPSLPYLNIIGLNDDPANPPQKSVKVNYTIKNDESFGTSQVKVSFYISRDGVIDPTPDVGDLKIGETLTGAIGPNSQFSGSADVLLPVADSQFWLKDGIYYIGAFINSDNQITETKRDDNLNQGLGKDLAAIDIRQIPYVDAVGGGFTVTNPRTFTPGSEVTIQYKVTNLGNRTVSINEGFNLGFYLSTNPIIAESSNDYDFTPFGYTPPEGISLPARGDSGNKTITLTLPTLENWQGWSQLSGPQKVYIGMVENANRIVIEPDLTNNASQGVNIDLAEITVNV